MRFGGGKTETIVQDEAAGAPPVVEEEEVPPPPPPPRPPRPLIWPWLLLLLLLVIGGLLAAWFLTRDNDHKNVVTQTTTVTLGAGVVKVPDVVGERSRAAISTLQQHGFKVRVAHVASSKPASVVIAQDPAAGVRVAQGSTELLQVSRGVVSVPDVVGQSRASAVSTIRRAGLKPQAFTVSSTEPKGTVVAQRPSAGASVPRGSKVRLNLSNGRTTGGGSPPPPLPPPPALKTVAVPDLTGQPQAAAQRQLNTAGLKVGVVYVPSDQPQGSVVSQSPVAGTTVKRGTRIQLNASLGPNAGAQQTVPNVVGMTPQQARARLTSAGFTVQQLTRKVSVHSQDGRVVDEQPAGGRKAPAGSAVTIYVGRF